MKYTLTGPWPPEPRKPRKRVECWGVAFDDGEVLPEQFKEDAEESLRNWTEGDGDHCGARLIHLREVEDGSSTLPDTLVEKAARAIAVREGLDPDAPIDFLDNADVLSTYPTWEDFYGQARAALEAAAPSLIAQGMRMAAEMADRTFCELIIRTPALYCEPANYCTQGARARAAEIEGGKG